MPGVLMTALQSLAILIGGLVAGSMFGIWRGYELAGYTPATFLEVHQGAVRGLNTLLPAMAGACIVLTVLLAILARNRPTVLWLYLCTALLLIIGGAVTRFANQPINEQVMAWTANSLPENWTALRDSWWNWHLARLAAGMAGELLLILAVFADRETSV
jgi:uncharacterized membrane protein